MWKEDLMSPEIINGFDVTVEAIIDIVAPVTDAQRNAIKEIVNLDRKYAYKYALEELSLEDINS